MDHVSSLLLLGIYVGFCLVYFLLKWLLYMFLGWTFFDKNRTNMWLESYSSLIYYVGFALFPFVLFLVYFDLSFINLIIIGSIILIFTKILMFYKWIKLFFHQFGDLFLLILYFCALEIVPVSYTHLYNTKHTGSREHGIREGFHSYYSCLLYTSRCV